MNIAGLKRDAAYIDSQMIDGKDDSMITKAPCSIIIPARHVERGLATLEPEVNIVSIYATVMDGRYCVCTESTGIKLTPNEINRIDIGGVAYIEFTFVKGAVISPNQNLVVRNETVYFVYNELIAQGNVPWFLTEEDLAILYDNAPLYAGVRIGANEAVWEMVVSSVLRNPNDKMQYYRHFAKAPGDLLKAPAAIVPLRSVTYGPTNTPARLIGNHMKEAITVALVNPSESVTPIEDQLRR